MRPTFGYVIPSVPPFTDPAAFVDLLQAGEALGYADVWFGDHVVLPRYAAHLIQPDWVDPLAACCFGLGHTSRLRFGTDVLVAPYRHPALVAKMVASADHLSGGRLVLGVGVGYLRGEFAILGLDPADRGSRTDELLDVLDLLWNGGDDALEYAGTHFSFQEAVFGPAPTQRPMPLWVGGNGSRALRRAATRGNGWHPLFPTPDGYAAGRRLILDRRTADTPFTFSYSCAVTTLLDANPATYTTGTWDEVPDIPDDFSYSPPIPTAADGRPLFVGTPDLVAGDVAAFVAAGVEHFTLRFASGVPGHGADHLSAQMRRFAEEVAPQFQ